MFRMHCTLTHDANNDSCNRQGHCILIEQPQEPCRTGFLFPGVHCTMPPSLPPPPFFFLFSPLVIDFSHHHNTGPVLQAGSPSHQRSCQELSTRSSSGSAPVSLSPGFTAFGSGGLGISRCTDRSAGLMTKPAGAPLQPLLAHSSCLCEQLCLEGDLARLAASFSDKQSFYI